MFPKKHAKVTMAQNYIFCIQSNCGRYTVVITDSVSTVYTIRKTKREEEKKMREYFIQFKWILSENNECRPGLLNGLIITWI